MGDGLGVLIVGDLKRVDRSTLVPLGLGELQIVLHSHEDVAKLIRDFIGLDAEDVIRGLVKPIAQVAGAGGEFVHRLGRLFKDPYTRDAPDTGESSDRRPTPQPSTRLT